MNHPRLMRIHNNMKQRCNNPNNTVYKNYGAKGIRVCDEWKYFKNFKNWALKNGYNDTLTIDRIDSNGNYEPSNCRWVSRKVQANNRETNVNIEFNGETHTLTEWAEKLCISQKTLWARLNNPEWTTERALTERPHKEFSGGKTLTHNGETHSIWEWARITGIKPTTISARINRSGWAIDKALTVGARC